MPTQVHIVGTRPNFVKAAPVIHAVREAGETPTLIHTGQHYEEALSGVFLSELGIPTPHRNLGVGSGPHAHQTANLMLALEEVLVEERPDVVVVYGDVNSTLAASLVAVKLNIDVAHVEAGLRSFDRSMPEEINRVVTDAISAVHFTTSEEAVDHLTREGIAGDGVHFVGNPMIDTLLRFQSRWGDSDVRNRLGIEGEYGVATLHRPANVDELSTAEGLVAAIGRVAQQIPVVIPLHPRGREALGALGLMDLAYVTVVEPMGYIDFMSLVSAASVVLTDSGGVQEETTVLGIPCLTLRENTERPVTISHGTNRLVGHDPENIVSAVIEVLADPPRGRIPPLWDGHAGYRIAEILRK